MVGITRSRVIFFALGSTSTEHYHSMPLTLISTYFFDFRLAIGIHAPSCSKLYLVWIINMLAEDSMPEHLRQACVAYIAQTYSDYFCWFHQCGKSVLISFRQVLDLSCFKIRAFILYYNHLQPK